MLTRFVDEMCLICEKPIGRIDIQDVYSKIGGPVDLQRAKDAGKPVEVYHKVCYAMHHATQHTSATTWRRLISEQTDAAKAKARKR